MEFKDLKIGDPVYILESTGTFTKTNAYNIGTVSAIGTVYEDNSLSNPYLSNVLKKKLIDITISCNGIQKKLTVNAEKNLMSDSTIGLTIAISKKDLITQVTQQFKECEAKIASIEFYKNEANKCRQILSQLNETIKNVPDVIEHESIKVD